MKSKKKTNTIDIKDSTPTLVIIILLGVFLTAGVFYYSFHGLSSGPLDTYRPVTETGSFQVTVVNDKGEPLPEATIIHSTPGETATTHTSDQNGKVYLSGTKGKKQTLEIAGAAFERKIVSMYCCEDEYISLAAKTEEEILLRLHGSNTVGAQLAPALAEGYLQKLGAEKVTTQSTEEANEVRVEGTIENKRLVIAIAAHGSSTGFKSLAAGDCDIAMSSRKIKEKEVENLNPMGDMTSIAGEHVLALDGIAVIVHQSNPLKTLTVAQAASIFNGEIRDWSAIGAREGKINVYSRDDKSGTYDTFKSLVLRKSQLVSDAKRFESNADLSDEVAADENGIGFTSLPNIRNAKPLAISDGDIAILPNFFTVATEDYGLSRRLYLYTPTHSKNTYIKDFISFALNQEGQKIVETNNLVDLNIRNFVSRIAADQSVQDKKTFEQYRKAVENAKRLSLNFRFKRDGFELDNRGYRDLDRMVDYLKSYIDQDVQVVLIGFTDSLGDYAYNYNLALKRARNVAEEFQARGISFIDILSAAEEVPVASNETPVGQQKNRRVEVWLKTSAEGHLSLN